MNALALVLVLVIGIVNLVETKGGRIVPPAEGGQEGVAQFIGVSDVSIEDEGAAILVLCLDYGTRIYQGKGYAFLDRARIEEGHCLYTFRAHEGRRRQRLSGSQKLGLAYASPDDGFGASRIEHRESYDGRLLEQPYTMKLAQADARPMGGNELAFSGAGRISGQQQRYVEQRASENGERDRHPYQKPFWPPEIPIWVFLIFFWGGFGLLAWRGPGVMAIGTLVVALGLAGANYAGEEAASKRKAQDASQHDPRHEYTKVHVSP